MKRKEIKSQIEAWIADMESQATDRRTGRTISLNTMALKVLTNLCFLRDRNWLSQHQQMS